MKIAKCTVPILLVIGAACMITYTIIQLTHIPQIETDDDYDELEDCIIV